MKKIAAVVVSAAMIMTMALSAAADGAYKNWTQGDPRWAYKTLGVSDENMSQVGCAVTSIAMLAVHSGSISESNFDPGVLCDFLSKNDGFDSWANVYWGAVTKLVPDLTYQKKVTFADRSRSALVSEVANYINQGYYLILSVNYDSHWVAVDTVSNGQIYMMDPAQSSIKKLFDRYDESGVLQAKLYKGKNAPAKVSGESSQQPTSYTVGHYKVTTDLNLRSSSSSSSSKIGLVPEGTSVVVTKVSGSWGQIEYEKKTGWICLEYAENIENLYSYKTGVYKTLDSVYLRNGVGAENTALCLVPKGTALKIRFVDSGWGKTTYKDKSGYVCMEYLSFVGDVPLITTAKQTTAAKTTTTKTTTTKVTTAKTTAKTTPAATTSATVPVQVPAMVGDLNGSGTITKVDIIMLNQYIAKPYKTTAAMLKIMDVNGDGTIDARDSVYLLKIMNRG